MGMAYSGNTAPWGLPQQQALQHGATPQDGAVQAPLGDQGVQRWYGPTEFLAAGPGQAPLGDQGVQRWYGPTQFLAGGAGQAPSNIASNQSVMGGMVGMSSPGMLPQMPQHGGCPPWMPNCRGQGGGGGGGFAGTTGLGPFAGGMIAPVQAQAPPTYSATWEGPSPTTTGPW